MVRKKATTGGKPPPTTENSTNDAPPAGTWTPPTSASDSTKITEDLTTESAAPAASHISRTSDIQGLSSESTDTNTFIITSFLNLMESGEIKIPGITIDTVDSEEKRQADRDKSYKTPSFSVPIFDEKEKLHGYRNFRAWKTKFELSLESNMLLPFI